MNIKQTQWARIARAIALLGCSAASLYGTALAGNPNPIPRPTKAFVVNRMDSSVALIDFDSMKELGSFHVGPLPYFAAISGDGKTLAISVEGEEKIKFYDPHTLAQKGEIHFGKMYAEHMAMLPDGAHMLMANRYQDAVVIINLTTMKEEYRIPVSSPHNLRLGSSGKYAYATSKLNPGVSVIDLESRKVKLFIPTKFVPRGLATSPDESKIYVGANWVNGMFEFDAASGKLLRFDQMPLPEGKTSVIESTYHGFEPIGNDLILGTNEGLSALDVIDVKTGKLLNRTTNVANPGAILEVPGMRSTVLMTNMGNNTIELVELTADHQFKTLKTMKSGVGIADLPKRFTFYYP